MNLSELIAGKKVAIFAVPGAFTPGCSKSHLPSFITAQDELKAKGKKMCCAYYVQIQMLKSNLSRFH